MLAFLIDQYQKGAIQVFKQTLHELISPFASHRKQYAIPPTGTLDVPEMSKRSNPGTQTPSVKLSPSSVLFLMELGLQQLLVGQFRLVLGDQ